jgi:hypothetical protein
VALVLVIPVFRTLDGARDLAAVPYTFDTITQRSAARIVNGLAAPGDRVLAYEVQSRYWLRRDVEILSLDGITDGKVFPYEKRGRLPAFLLRYRPRFWIADTATDIERDRPGVAIRRSLSGRQPSHRGREAHARRPATADHHRRRHRVPSPGFAVTAPAGRRGVDHGLRAALRLTVPSHGWN